MNLMKLYAELGLDTSGFDRGVKGAVSSGKNLAGMLSSSIGGASTFVANKVSATTVMLGHLMADAAKQGISLVKQVGTAGINYNATMETYATNFRTMLGGSSEAAELLTDDLESMASSTPFAMTDLADATQTLLAFGQDSSTVLDTLQQLGDISMGDANNLKSLTLAFAQASSSGKLMGQDLMQMINAGFNPLQTIVDKTGVSMGDLKDFMEDGKPSKALKKAMREAQKEVRLLGDEASDGAKMLVQMSKDGAISADLLAQIFSIETEPGGKFYGAMEAASKTLSGMLSTLEDDSTKLMGKFFQPMTSFLTDDILPSAIDLVRVMSDAYDVDGMTGAFTAATAFVGDKLKSWAPMALEAGSNVLASIYTGLTGDPTTGAAVSAYLTGLWADGEEAVGKLLTAGKGLLSGIADAFMGSTDGDMIKSTLAGMFSDGISKAGELLTQGKNLLGNIYTTITGQEATAKNIGNTIGGIFKAGVDAADDLISVSTEFFTNLNTALGDPDASIGEKIAGVFNAGNTAMSHLLQSAGNFMSDLYAAITGDEEGAKKIEDFTTALFETPEEQEKRLAAERKVTEEETYSWKVENPDVLMGWLSSMYNDFLQPGGLGYSTFEDWQGVLMRGVGDERYREVAEAIFQAYNEKQAGGATSPAAETGASDEETARLAAAMAAAVKEANGGEGNPINVQVDAYIDGHVLTNAIYDKVMTRIDRQLQQRRYATP